ncbi:MAG: antitoxin [Solirubrobacteraceae bacterium]
MSKRLQVVVGDEELERYARTAEAVGLSMSEWVRQSLRTAEREVSTGNVEAKLAAIRKAASYNFQEREVDIDTMLAETEAGRLAEIEAGMSGAGDA